MMQGTYEIIETPEGKYTLRWKKGQAGPFDDKPAAERAMKRVIRPAVYNYDVDGKPLD